MVGPLREKFAGGHRKAVPVTLRFERLPQIEVGAGDLEVERERRPRLGFGFGIATGSEQHPRQRGACRQRVGLQANRFAVDALGLIEPPLLRTHFAEVAMRADVITLQRDRPAKAGLGPGAASLPVGGHAETSVQRGMIRYAQRVAICPLGLGVTSLASEPEREVGVSADARRLEAYRLAQHTFRVRVPPLAPERDAELVEKISVVRPRRDSAAQLGFRLRVAAQCAECDTASGVKVGIVRAKTQRVRVHVSLFGATAATA